MMKLQEFIRDNEDWEHVLSHKPYSLKIKRDNGYILFAYNQVESSFSRDIVQESRGVILRESDMEVVCRPFDKFFNIQEGHADTINWDTARVQEKLDGSIMKLWFNDGLWRISTNGMIDAAKATVGYGDRTFADLFWKALYSTLRPGVYSTTIPDRAIDDLLFILNINFTYIFELCTPYNRVVTRFTEYKLFHIGTRQNATGKEMIHNIGIPKPKEFTFNGLDEIMNTVETLPFDEEGYVVVDANWNRVKIKSPAYVAVHYLKSNWSVRRMLELIIVNETSEFLSYFPEYKIDVDNVTTALNNYIKKVQVQIDYIRRHSLLDLKRKDFAFWATQDSIIEQGIMFRFYQNQDFDWERAIKTIPIKRLINKIGLKDDGEED